MKRFQSILDELELALRIGSPSKRTEILRQVTGLFIQDGTRLSPDQISLFGDVMGHLVEKIEKRARVELSARLAPVAHAPAKVIRRLAAEDSAEIAGPVLKQSERLSEQDLIEIAQTKGRSHQLSIADRRGLSETVSDVLIDSCDAAVAEKVANNAGARISEAGFAKLNIMADGNDHLTKAIASRPDLPPQVFRQLLVHATEQAQQALISSAPISAQDGLRKIVNDEAERLRSSFAVEHYAKALQQVSDLRFDTALARRKLADFANAKIIGKTAATLSLLSAVPIELVDRLLNDPSPYGLIVLCKALGLDWRTTSAIVVVGPSACADPAKLENLSKDFEKLTAPTAGRLLRFWQVGQSVNASSSQRPLREIAQFEPA